MIFICLTTRAHKKATLINVNHIIQVIEHDLSGSCIYLGKDYIEVRETPDTVAALLSDSGALVCGGPYDGE